MKKENRIPFIGVILSSVVSYLLIHFWFADLFASLQGVSRDTAYAEQVTLLVLFTVWRGWRTARGKDELANWTDRQLGKKTKSNGPANPDAQSNDHGDNG